MCPSLSLPLPCSVMAVLTLTLLSAPAFAVGALFAGSVSASDVRVTVTPLLVIEPLLFKIALIAEPLIVNVSSIFPLNLPTNLLCESYILIKS